MFCQENICTDLYRQKVQFPVVIVYSNSVLVKSLLYSKFPDVVLAVFYQCPVVLAVFYQFPVVLAVLTVSCSLCCINSVL